MHNVNVEIAYGNGGEEMANEVVVGDNITVMISTNEGFWIILVSTPVHMVKEHFTNEWGQKGLEGDYVLQGLWYKRLHPSNKSYYLLEDSPPTYVYSHLVMPSKFVLPPTTHVVRASLCTYELSADVLAIIHEGMEHLWCTDEPRATTNTQDSPRPKLGGSHHLPPYSIICA
jgi:hypothetical protein